MSSNTVVSTHRQKFEAEIARLTSPLHGQFPRPWMTKLADPQAASLFIVGRNPATAYPTDKLTHQRHIDALFNRAGESCEDLYQKIRKLLEEDGVAGVEEARRRSRGTPTRGNSQMLRDCLEREHVDGILETNVVCYSTPKSRHLSNPEHKGGRERGEEIFAFLLKSVRPRVLIAHGKATSRDLVRLLKKDLPQPPSESAEPQPTDINGMKIFVIPSLALPEWNKWCRWAEEYLRKVDVRHQDETVRSPC